MKSYEELTGATGTRIRYEAEKFSPKELFRQFPPRVVVAGHALPLAQFSLSSVTVLMSSAVDLDLIEGDEPMIDVRIGEQRFFYGPGRVTEVDRSGPTRRVDVSLKGGFLNLAQMIDHHESMVFDRELLVGLHEAEVGILPAYRQIITDALFLLRRYGSALQRFEGKLSAQGTFTDARALDMLARSEERILPDWRNLVERANSLLRTIRDDQQAIYAHKRLSELVLTPELLNGPIWKRAYEKPLGYPGDFQLMSMVYSWSRMGETLYDKLLHFLGLDGLECVATRMVVVQQAIGRLLAERADAIEPIRITNLGAGSAQEVRNILAEPRLVAPVAFTLIDQDRSALAETHAAIYPDVVKHKNRATVDCLHVSFIELMRAGELFQRLPPQHLIYSVGLLDYLGEMRAKALVQALYDQLAPGGTLLIANLADVSFSGYWQAEMICDWSMIYRTEPEMRAMVAGLGGARVTLQTEPRELVYLMTIRKPE